MRDTKKSEKIKNMKGVEKIAMLTAYDYSMAGLEAANNLDIILVGDSANFVLNGRNTTRGITVDEMALLTRRVVQGVENYCGFSLVISDLPDGSYDNVQSAIKNAHLLWEAGADGVKLEGGIEKPNLDKIISAIVKEGIPVQGHIGYTPQSESHVDKGHVQGKTKEGIRKLFDDYKLLEDAGVFSVVLECVPWQVSKRLTEKFNVPSIGIGAGSHCDGQVLVVYDFLGLTPGMGGYAGKFPKFVWSYDRSAPLAIKQYVKDVKEGIMPDLEHSYSLKDDKLILNNLIYFKS